MYFQSSYQLLLKAYYSLQLTAVEQQCIHRPKHNIFTLKIHDHLNEDSTP
jgi:hypothetical protein